MAARPLRGHLKRLAFSSHLLPRYHRSRNPQTLTVVTFHRVLDEGDERWAYADPRYTVTSAFFRACLEFFRNHYEPVSGQAVVEASQGAAPLPPHALLVTLDDGWADTAECALPVLLDLECPATVFVTPSVVGSAESFWQPRLFAAWKLGGKSGVDLDWAWATSGNGPPPPPDWSELAAVHALIDRLHTASPAARSDIVRRLEEGVPALRPQMLSRRQLKELLGRGVEIGAHGATHEPLAQLPEAAEEIRLSRSLLEELLAEPVLSMSFPHGSYDETALSAARKEFEAVYTSKTTLNQTTGGMLSSPVLGRIGIAGEELADPDGRLRPELLALWLFRRPIGVV